MHLCYRASEFIELDEVNFQQNFICRIQVKGSCSEYLKISSKGEKPETDELIRNNVGILYKALIRTEYGIQSHN